MEGSLSTTAAPVAVESHPVGVVRRFRARVAAVLVALTCLVVGSAPAALAQTAPGDLTGGAGTAYFDKITAYIQGPLGIATLTLFAVVVGFGLVMRWGKKSVSK